LKRALAAAAMLLPLWAAAQSVAAAGQMGSKVLLVIDGQTQMLAPGDSARGVRLVRVDGDSVVVDSNGRQTVLRIGGAPVRLAGGAGPSSAREVVIPASPGGHFFVSGAINGRAVQFLVDTGATLVAISSAEAQRLGIDHRQGQRVQMHTANGVIAGHVITLSALRVADVELANVQAVVIPAPMPGILLGNSVLARFSMRRDSDVMRLTLR
jgi:aspartyl protease family protein